MKGMEFSKYSLCGNTFLIIDESDLSLDDDLKKEFARSILDPHFGVGGADNLLFVSQLNANEKEDYRFRIFEQDGEETLFCGNGLLSVADFLYQKTGMKRFSIQTGKASEGVKKTVAIGKSTLLNHCWVDFDEPSLAPLELFSPSKEQRGILETVELKVSFPQKEKWNEFLPDSLELRGYFVFYGEPHLVLVLGEGLPRNLDESLFINSSANGEQQKLSAQLVHYIGEYVNRAYRELFPSGVHLNFVKTNDNDAFHYRTYERAINCETLACGSGAVASAFVLLKNELIEKALIKITPINCCLHKPNSLLNVEQDNERLILSGRPEKIYQGTRDYEL